MGQARVTRRRRIVATVPLVAAALLTGCGTGADPGPDAPVASGQTAAAGASGGSDGEDTDAPPTWTGGGAPEGTVSFADGPALDAATGVTFSDGLGDVWGWELTGDPESTTGASPAVTLELANSGNGCRVLDERAPYDGGSADDGAASTALVEERLAGAEVVAGPAQDLMGLKGGLGEGGPTYDVARALGRDADGRWLLVTARAFTALGAQQVVTVSCPTGAGIDVTRGQLAMVSYANLRGLEQYP